MHTVTRDHTASGASPLLRKASRARKTGFTLVELLVVLMIIGMLTAMVSFAMFRSMQAAREAKTQALISKLHNVLVRHWDTFETGQPPSGMTVAQWMADEMPCTAGEFSSSQLFSTTLGQTIAGTDPDAECLYQIILQLADDDLDRINFFSEEETKDLNNPEDGVADVFIDGWGNPIGFIRQPSSFTDSDINDPNTANPVLGTPGTYFPLIYSNGADKAAGLSAAGAATGSEHLDNIHNHRMNARLR